VEYGIQREGPVVKRYRCFQLCKNGKAVVSQTPTGESLRGRTSFLLSFIMLLSVVLVALGLGLVHAAPTVTTSSHAASGASAASGGQTHPTIDVDLGYTQYEGYKLPSGINQWLGMRYAAAPLGDLRFKAPQDPPKSGKQTAHKVRLHLIPRTPDLLLTFHSMEPSATLLLQPSSIRRTRKIVFSLTYLLQLTVLVRTLSTFSSREEASTLLPTPTRTLRS
jgi:hypothetical protein